QHEARRRCGPRFISTAVASASLVVRLLAELNALAPALVQALGLAVSHERLLVAHRRIAGVRHGVVVVVAAAHAVRARRTRLDAVGVVVRAPLGGFGLVLALAGPLLGARSGHARAAVAGGVRVLPVDVLSALVWVAHVAAPFALTAQCRQAAITAA